jgi:Xaa-Pro aminopeptidase
LLITRDSIKGIIPKIEENVFHDEEVKLDCVFFDKSEDKKKILHELISKKAKLGINFSTFNYQAGRVVEDEFGRDNIRDISKELYSIRAEKDDYEIEQIQKACDIVSKTSKEIPEMIKEGMTEIQLKRKIDDSLLDKKATKPSFDTLVGFGKNAALAHPPVADKKLKKGELILTDFGAMHKSGYCSDISRTFVLGLATKLQEKMYQGVQNTKYSTEKTLAPGLSLVEIQKNAVAMLKTYPGELTHSIGHSLGLEVHDGWAFGQPEIITNNYVTTIEPGLYHRDVGGVRIEDDYLVKKKEIINLTKKAISADELIKI